MSRNWSATVVSDKAHSCSGATKPASRGRVITTTPQSSDDAGVKSALRTLQILELLASEAPSELSFADLGTRLSIPSSSLHGLLQTMVKADWIRVDDRRYSLGFRCFEVGGAFIRDLEVTDRALPIMRRLRGELNETVQLAVLDGTENLYIAKVEGCQRLSLRSQVGQRLPAHSTALGKALLSGLTPEELIGAMPPTLPRLTAVTITSHSKLLAELEEVRRRGYSTDRGESTPGVCCVAVLIGSAERPGVAAMSVSVPAVRFDGLRAGAVTRALVAASSRLSEELGSARRVLR